MPQGDWFTISSMGNFGVVVLAVTLISQFFKGAVDRLAKFPTRLLVLIISWGILMGHRYITTGDLDFAGVYLDVLNGFLVALTAMGTHQIAKDHLKWK